MSVIIVGGGVAGGAAAALLAKGGARPLLLERAAEPHHKVCGEFISVECDDVLAALGVDLDALGAVMVAEVRLWAGAENAAAKLPFSARSLTRLRLDAALLEHAEKLGARIERGVTVRAIDGLDLDTSAGPLTAATLLLASGKHDVRGVKRDTTGTIDGLIGFKRYFRPSPAQRRALAGAVEVVLFDGGYAGLQLVEGGVANLCLLIDADRFAALGSWEALFAMLLAEPQLARRLGDAEALGDRPLSIARVPYGYVHPGGGAAYRLGDQAAVIPSFCGDGMAMALHGARLAAAAVLAGAPAAAFGDRLRGDIARQVRLATGLQRLGTTRLGRAAMVHGIALLPRAMGLLAALTRVPEAALRRAA